MKKIGILILLICAVIVGCASAAVTVANETTTPQMIGGDKGTYLVKANIDGANVTFDNDFKGVITNGTLNVEVYTTGTPYRVITVEKTGCTVFTANITEVPAKNGVVEISVTLVPVTKTEMTTAIANVTAPTTNGANVTVTNSVITSDATTVVETTPSATATKSGNLPIAAFAAFGIVGLLALRSRN